MSTETILLLSKRTLLTITTIIREYTELLTEKKGVLLLPSWYEIARLPSNFTPFVFLELHLGPKISQDISLCCQNKLF